MKKLLIIAFTTLLFVSPVIADFSVTSPRTKPVRREDEAIVVDRMFTEEPPSRRQSPNKSSLFGLLGKFFKSDDGEDSNSPDFSGTVGDWIEEHRLTGSFDMPDPELFNKIKSSMHRTGDESGMINSSGSFGQGFQNQEQTQQMMQKFMSQMLQMMNGENTQHQEFIQKLLARRDEFAQLGLDVTDLDALINSIIEQFGSLELSYEDLFSKLKNIDFSSWEGDMSDFQGNFSEIKGNKEQLMAVFNQAISEVKKLSEQYQNQYSKQQGEQYNDNGQKQFFSTSASSTVLKRGTGYSGDKFQSFRGPSGFMNRDIGSRFESESAQSGMLGSVMGFIRQTMSQFMGMFSF